MQGIKAIDHLVYAKVAKGAKKTKNRALRVIIGETKDPARSPHAAVLLDVELSAFGLGTSLHSERQIKV